MSFAQAGNSDIAPPHLDETGLAGYQEFLTGGHHRAFAIAPGGAWAWVADMPDPDVAESEAIRNCSGFTEQTCNIYAIDEQVVIDRDAWAGSWGPYAGAEAAADRPVGTARGTRFPDLVVTNPDGNPVKLSDLGGRIVFLHFWGSWCAPCQVEFPELQAMHDALKGKEGIAFVFVQAREDIDRSWRWARLRGFSMPFYDWPFGSRLRHGRRQQYRGSCRRAALSGHLCPGQPRARDVFPVQPAEQLGRIRAVAAPRRRTQAGLESPPALSRPVQFPPLICSVLRRDRR
jgi:thiol-disulfide isomerase/thioredoxin